VEPDVAQVCVECGLVGKPLSPLEVLLLLAGVGGGTVKEGAEMFDGVGMAGKGKDRLWKLRPRRGRGGRSPASSSYSGKGLSPPVGVVPEAMVIPI
jgi:hypothetical protein